MTEKYRGIKLPPNIIQRDFAKATIDHFKDNEDSQYGHAAASLLSSITGIAEIGGSKEKQEEMLRESAKELIKKYGPEFLKFMSTKLRLALTEKDLEEIKKDLEDK